MANGVSSRLQRLELSASDLKRMTVQKPGEPWDDALIEDYLNTLRDAALLAEEIDQNAGQIIAAQKNLSAGVQSNKSQISQNRARSLGNRERIKALEETDVGLVGRGGKVRRGTTQSAPSGDTKVVFNQAVFDDLSIVVGGVLTVPPGAERVMVSAGLRLEAPGTGLYGVRMLRNGLSDDELPYPAYHPSGATNILGFNLATGIIDAVPGDTFELEVVQTEGTATIQAGVWMSLGILR